MTMQSAARANGSRSQEKHSPLLLQRKCACGGTDDRCAKCDEEEGRTLQRFSGERRPAGRIPPSVDSVLQTTGRPLDVATRERFEPRFGYDFSSVRVHADASAAASVRDVRAHAYTVGKHIAFESGRYAPGTPLGDALLAHELAHVVQQDGRMGSVATKAEGSSSSALEADADRSARVATESLWSRAAGGARRIAADALPRLRTATRLSLGDCGCSPSPGGSSQEQEETPSSPSTAPTTTAAPPPQPPAPAFTPSDVVLAGTKKEWRVKYKTRREADAQRDFIKKLRIKVDDARQGTDKLWTFDYYPLTKSEAEAEKTAKEKALGPKYDVTVKESTRAGTWYLEILKKCPEGMDPKAGFKIWESCFPTEADANALVKKMKDAHVEAQSEKVDEGRWGVYYKPLTEAEAKTAGEAEAGKRAGAAEGMYKVTTSQKSELKTYTYATSTVCPPGWAEVGSNFLITAYALAQEKEFPETPKVKNPCGLTGEFRQKFLFQTSKAPRGVKMQGSGKSLGGDIIAYAPKSDGSDCFKVTSAVTTKSGTTATSGRTVAVDKSQIPLGTKLLIEDVGARTAEDTGGAIGKDHIDVYHGTDKTIMEASAIRMTGKKVCKKT